MVDTPVYNFTLPSQPRAWVDRIAVAGVTFKYGMNGAEGLTSGKLMILVPAQGNFYGEGPLASAFEQLET